MGNGGDGGTTPMLLTWEEYRRELRWAADDPGWGLHVGRYPVVEADQLTGQMLMLPAAQGSRPAANQGATVLLGVRGEVEVGVDDGGYVLGPRDVVSLPAETTHTLRNLDLDASLVLQLTCKTGPAIAGTPAEQGDWHESSRSPVHQPWEQSRRRFNWDLPRAQAWGSHRGSGPHYFAGTLRGHIVRQPSGQSCPWHQTGRDLLFLQLEGEVEFTTWGQTWHLRPLDIFRLPASTPYVYTNIGLAESIFCNSGGRVKAGTSTIYYESDPGWPVKAAAEVMETVAGPEGERREAAGH